MLIRGWEFCHLASFRLEKRAGAHSRLSFCISVRTEDVELLEDPDIHVLEIYCSVVARISTLRREINKLEQRLDEDFDDADFTAKDWLKTLQTMDSLQGKVLALEKAALSYADKLGLTPSSRAHLARKRADAAIEEDPDGDLFG